MKVDFVVCGKFHFHKYIKYIHAKNVLQRFIYSYKINYSMLIPKENLKNFFLKEYLMYLGAKVLKGRNFDRFLMFLHDIWQLQVRFLTPCKADIVEFLLHGNCYNIITKYKKNGAKVIGVIVNVHPIHQAEILSNEYKSNGLIYDAGEISFSTRMLKEIELCDILLAPSSFVKESYLKYEKNLSESKIVVLNYGLQDIPNKPTKKRINIGSKIKLLYVGQITFRKGVKYLLEAICELHNTGLDIELCLVGGMDKLYYSVIKDFQNFEYINFISNVPNHQMIKFMQEYDLFVIPTLEDGFAVVVSEALSVGLPVILTNHCGAKDLIEEGENGFVIESGSTVALKNAILNSIGYEFNLEKSYNETWEDYANGSINIYKKLLNQN